jgi:hypothetical protein
MEEHKMNCPNCYTYNEPGNQFCISCGQLLTAANSATTPIAAATGPGQRARQLLGVQTLRIVFGLLLLFLFYRVLVNLSFVENLAIPDFPLTATAIIRSLTYLIALVLLLGYAQTLRDLWPQAFPKWSAITPVLTALLYVAVIAAVYSAIASPLLVLTRESDAVLVLQVVLLILAVFILGTAWMSFYSEMPGWLGNLRLNMAPITSPQTACLNCGRLNPVENEYCGHCGQALRDSAATIAES